MKNGVAKFEYNFSDDQWSWIEQNMECLNISERMAARAGMFFAKSAQLDPDFWAKGWDWGNLSSYDPLIRQAMFLLSSGIFEWEILTENGWLFINIGEWIKSQGIEIRNFLAGGNEIWGTVNPSKEILINLSLHKRIGCNAFDVASTILHEATHLLLERTSLSTTSYTFTAFLKALWKQESIAYSIQGYYFLGLMSKTYRAIWEENARRWIWLGK